MVYEAGSALVHIHVRDKDENPSSDPICSRAAGGDKEALPWMIIQFSTGGRGRKPQERAGQALSEAGHGLADHGLGQLPKSDLREPS